MFNLKEEVICDHLVTEETKKLWKVELDILEEVKRVCRKHNIKYFAGGGTLLGAVRHKGFIPWDDDIDLFMLSEDYKKFCKVAAEEFKTPYFFQHYSTQEVDNFGFTRIRNSNTTCCTNMEYVTRKYKDEYNCGIFIDVFPLNYVPDSKLKLMWQKFWMRLSGSMLLGYQLERNAKFDGTKPPRSFAVILRKITKLFIGKDKLFRNAYKACDMYRSGNKVGLVSFIRHMDKYIWDRSWFDETVDLPFADTTICCPKEYDKILRRQYGNYSEIVKGGQIHLLQILDTETSYEQKLEEYTTE